MVPTPPSADAAQSASPTNDDKTRRNVACVNCRNSKVRCKTSVTLGQPCQRCQKLQLSCVVDKFHKRVTKRSKLELLEQELKNIKQVVGTTGQNDSAWSPPSPRASYSNFSEPSTLSRAFAPAITQVVTPISERPVSAGPSAQIVDLPSRAISAQPRALGEHVVSGEDIDWYFNKFLQCFHPFLPILRKRHPDECYESCPTLFWVVLYITCRRYTKDRVFFSSLAEYLSKDIWQMLANPVLNLEAIHALLYLATWPLPSIRLVTDPSTTLVSIAMTNSMMMGLHTGRGSHREFCIGARKNCETTDEEASSTWIACCMLAQKIASCSGHPPPSIRLDDGVCKSKMDSPFWSDLIIMFEIQKFMNRFHTSMAAHISSCGGVSHTVVSMWESELEVVKPLIIKSHTELTVFLSLAALLEMQIFYFNPDNVIHQLPSPVNIAKAFHTGRALITTVLDQEACTKFLTHAPHWVFRLVVDAACIVIAILHSVSAPDMSAKDANILGQQACAAVHRCSVQENDLAHRSGVIIETFWTYRHMLPKLELGACTWASRLSVGFTFWCLDKFKAGLQAAQRTNDGIGSTKGQETIQTGYDLTVAGSEAQLLGQPALTLGPQQIQVQPQLQPLSHNNQNSSLFMQNDALMEVDWNMFMEEFGWVNENGVLLGLP